MFEPPTKVSKRGWGLTGPQGGRFQRGMLGKRGVTFFSEGCNFHIKNKLKPEMFNDKKSL